MARRKDIRIMDAGSFIIIEPMTAKAAGWIDENIGADNGYHPQYPTIMVEHRYADDVLDGMAADGLRW